MTSCILIPARASEKNIHPLAGYPLVEYAMAAAQKSKKADRIICSTNDPKIADIAEKYPRVEVEARPEPYALPGSHITSYLAGHFIPYHQDVEILLLAQPTSPFVTGQLMDQVLKEFKLRPHANSVQTVIDVPHNFHEYNQRFVDAYGVHWTHPDERRGTPHKQDKPPRFAFGNLVACRTKMCSGPLGLFAEPSIPILISFWDGFDVDRMEDFETAEALVEAGLVEHEL